MDLIDFLGESEISGQPNDVIEPKTNPEYVTSSVQQLKIGEDEEGVKTGKLLDQFFIVTSKIGVKRSEAQTIKYCTVKESPLPPWYTRLPIFCFPDDIPVVSESHFYTFVLTDVNGKQQYGHCKRIPSLGSTNEIECLCLLTHQSGYFNLMYKLLEILEERYLVSILAIEQILIVVKDLSLQSISEVPTFKLYVKSNFKHLPSEYELSIKENSDELLKQTFSVLKVSKLLSLFASLLFERRIILCSENLSILSACCHSLLTLLKPFSWQHVYIPILPRDILEYCMAPMPFFIGIHSSCKQIVKLMPLDDVVFCELDVEENSITDGLNLPHQQTLALQQSLDKIFAEASKHDRFDAFSIRNAFKDWFSKVFGHQFLFETTPTNIEEYLKLKFQNRGIRRFMEFFCKSQMFERFVSETKHESVPSNYALSIGPTEYTKKERLMNTFHSLSYENKKLFHAKAQVFSQQLKRYMNSESAVTRSRLKESVNKHLNTSAMFVDKKREIDWDSEEESFTASWKSSSESQELDNSDEQPKNNFSNLIDLDERNFAPSKKPQEQSQPSQPNIMDLLIEFPPFLSANPTLEESTRNVVSSVVSPTSSIPSITSISAVPSSIDSNSSSIPSSTGSTPSISPTSFSMASQPMLFPQNSPSYVPLVNQNQFPSSQSLLNSHNSTSLPTSNFNSWTQFGDSFNHTSPVQATFGFGDSIDPSTPTFNPVQLMNNSSLSQSSMRSNGISNHSSSFQNNSFSSHPQPPTHHNIFPSTSDFFNSPLGLNLPQKTKK